MSIRNLQQRSAKVAGLTFLLLLPIGLYANLIAPKVGLIMFACDLIIAVAFYLLLRNTNFYLALIGSFFRIINAALVVSQSSNRLIIVHSSVSYFLAWAWQFTDMSFINQRLFLNYYQPFIHSRQYSFQSVVLSN